MGITQVDEGVEKRREKSTKERNFPRYGIGALQQHFSRLH